MAIVGISETPRPYQRGLQACYSLQAVHPATGTAFDKKYPTMEAALAHGSALMDDGYCIEIWSPADLEKRPRPRSRASGLHRLRHRTA